MAETTGRNWEFPRKWSVIASRTWKIPEEQKSAKGPKPVITAIKESKIVSQRAAIWPPAFTYYTNELNLFVVLLICAVALVLKEAIFAIYCRRSLAYEFIVCWWASNFHHTQTDKWLWNELIRYVCVLCDSGFCLKDVIVPPSVNCIFVVKNALNDFVPMPYGYHQVSSF